MARLACAAALAGLLAGCEAPISYESGPTSPAAGEVSRPSFSVGDEFWYTTGRGTYVEVYAGEEDGRLLFDRTTQFQTRVYTPDLALLQIRTSTGVREGFKPDDGRLSFPLRPGKTWELTYRVFDTGSRPGVQRTRACQVMENGFATVPAGRFEVVRIDCTLRELGVLEVDEEQVYYAPEVGRVILRQSERRGFRERLLEYTRAVPP